MSTPEVAKAFSGIRDVPTYIGEISPGRRWWLGPWRPIEWAAIALIGSPTWWIVAHRPIGSTRPVLLTGVTLLAVVLVAMRFFLPKHRPSLPARAGFACNALRPPRGTYERPTQVIGNLVYTRGGVYAEYRFDGVSSVSDAEASHTDAAQLTRNLGRYLPSGFMVRALLVPEDPDATALAMVGRHADKPEWVRQCRLWTPIIANPAKAYNITNNLDDDEDTEVDVPARQQFWLSIPVDCGVAGRTRLRFGIRAWQWIKGLDAGSDEQVRDYTQTAAQIVAALPGKFNVTAATPEQISWYWRHRAGLGVYHEPMPATVVEPDTLDENNFWAIEFDEGDNKDRPWWRPSLQPYVRVGDSFQTFLTVEHFPATGVGFPRSYFLHTLLRLETPAVIEWTQHHTVRTPEQAAPINRRKKKNIRDQIRQRGPDSESIGELFDQLDGTDEYCAHLESTPAERELDHTIIIAVGAADPSVLDDAVTLIRQEFDKLGIVVARRVGAQAALSKAFLTGSENQAGLDEFRIPTTAHLWSLFLPFISSWVGDTKGSPLAIDHTTATTHPAIILDEPESAARHDLPTMIAKVGDPGGGKSKRTKISFYELLMRGGRGVVFEPDLISEWRKGLLPFEHLGIRFIDPIETDEWCFDTLLMYPGERGRRLSASHVLPWIGLSANDRQAKRYRRLLRQDGIGSHNDLLTYLRGLADPDNDELLDRLETAAEDFPAFFDTTRSVYRPDECAATVYLTGHMDLPDPEEMDTEHLFLAMETTRRTGIFMYGLLVHIEQEYMFSRVDRFDWMVFEECQELCSYRQGARILHKISKRGRKHNTGGVLITQDFHAIKAMNDEFVTEKHIVRIKNRQLAFETLQWAGFDVQHQFDGLVTELCENTSPGNTRRADDERGEAGAVDYWRRGEGFLVDKLGRRARVQFLDAPTREQAEATNTSVTGGAGMAA